MSENREPENREEYSDHSHEPIDSIEKTVEELKKKIQELSEEQEKALEEEESSSNATKITEFTENAKEFVSASIDELKDMAGSVSSNEDLQKTIAYIKENAMKAVTGAKVKVDEIRNDPKTAENTEKAKEAVRSAAESVNETARKAGDYINDHLDDDTKEAIKEAYDNACRTIDKGVAKAAEEIDDFCRREDVQATVNKAKDLVGRGTESLKGFMKSLKDSNRKSE